MTDLRVVDVGALADYMGSYCNRSKPPSAVEFKHLVLDYMAGRPKAPAQTVDAEFAWDDWVTLDAQEQVRSTAQAHRSGVLWMKELASCVERVALHYSMAVDKAGGRVGDVIDTVHRALVVTVRFILSSSPQSRWQDVLRVSEDLMRETINLHVADRDWRLCVVGQDLLWAGNGRALFGYEWGSVGRHGPRDTGATWPKKLTKVWAPVEKKQSDLDKALEVSRA